MKKDMIGVIACVAIVIVASAAVCVSLAKEDNQVVADTVVLGKIYTSNENGDYAQALAVKDGKYIYVGDADGVDKYIKKGTTKVIDYNNKGLIMAGATEGHGHYAMQGVLVALGLGLTGDTPEKILDNVRAYVANHPDNSLYFTFGWNNVKMQTIKATYDMRSALDEICSDKVMMILDDSGHNAFCNSKAFEVAGVTKETVIRGGVIAKDATTGELLGLVSDMANNYVIKKAVSTQSLITEENYAKICQAMEKSLHKNGYTNYQDGWLNYFGAQALDCLMSYDNSTGLTIYLGGSHKIDSYDDWDAELDLAEQYMEKYDTEHFSYNTIKLFADGEAVESMSGWMKDEDAYADGSTGTQVWDTDTMNAIVKEANEKGLSVHVHAQGSAATEQVVNAYVAAKNTAKDGVYNGICHGRNITEETKQKMAENDIYAAININWRVLVDQKDADKVTQVLSLDVAKAGYPVKSLLDKGVVVTSSTDVPSDAGAPTSVCGIIEVAVNDTRPEFEVWELDPNEKVSVEQAIDIMTINGAKQLQIEDSRGSIEVGKFADFLFLDRDITTCAPETIHEGNVVSVYFEGKEVYRTDLKN